MFKKLLGQPRNALFSKLKQMGASTLTLHSPPPTYRAVIGPSTQAKADTIKKASASKSKFSSHFDLMVPLVIGSIIDRLSLLFA